MSSFRLIQEELENLGYTTENITPANHDTVIVFDYTVDVGRYRNSTFRVGISLQDGGYPEYPPHFFHICNAPAIDLTPHLNYQENGQEWCAFSVPPSDFCDRLPPEDKNMATYLHRHIRRFWDNA